MGLSTYRRWVKRALVSTPSSLGNARNKGRTGTQVITPVLPVNLLAVSIDSN